MKNKGIVFFSIICVFSPDLISFLDAEFSEYLCHKDSEQWFFFIPRQESEARGGRPRRLTTTGYWKATGSPGCVYSSNSRPIGVKRTMVFYNGRAPNGRKTEWKMNEYKAIEEAASSNGATSPVRNHILYHTSMMKMMCLKGLEKDKIHNQVPNGT